jgi:cytochrome P450
MLNKIGIESANFKILKEAMVKSHDISAIKAYRFMEKKRIGDTNEIQNKSWLAHAMKRQAAEDSDITEEEMITLVGSGLSAAVDTTSGFLSWVILHLSLNPSIQERLYNDLQEDIFNDDTANGRLTSNIVKNNPYLNAVVRETHRITPNSPVSVIKKVAKDITIHGQDFPADTMFIFDSFSTGKDPNILDDPETYIPERWLPEEVVGRKNTHKAIIDNVFFKDPFSQGARKCPGSRVANNEIHALIAQLVLDWKIHAPGLDSYKDVPYSLQGTVTPHLPKIEFSPR